MHYSKPKSAFWLLSLAILIASSLSVAFAASDRLEVVYPNLNGQGKNNLGYRVLKLALEKSGQQFNLKLSPHAVNDERTRALLANGDISIADFGSGEQFEKDFSAIHFPIDRGLLGYRLFVIRAASAAEFGAISSLPDLLKFSAGQGLGWSDIAILENAGLQIRKAPTLLSLFPMLEAARFDFLPLGLNEVYGLLDDYTANAPSAMLRVDTHCVLIYRFARLFYVAKGNTELHDAVLAGLKKSFDDGSFQLLLNTDPAISSAIKHANLKQRTVLKIDNPSLSEAFKSIPEAYFFKQEEFK